VTSSLSVRRLLAIVAAIVMAAVLLALPRVARADEALARERFRAGVALYDKKQYQPALDAFRAAYAEKPSPAIKQNIALSLKGLGRNVEAATAFDEALDEGATTLSPDTRAAMERELAELSKLVATVRLRFVAAADQRTLDDVRVTVAPAGAEKDKTTLSPAAAKRPVRLEPGIYVFTAHHEGLADPPQKKLSLLAGSPVDATFEIGTPPVPPGKLTVRANVPGATISVDRGPPMLGGWTGHLAEGKHQIAVSAPGYQPLDNTVFISSGTDVEYPVALLPLGDLPPGYTLPPRKAPPPEGKKRYLVPMLAYEGQSFRLSPLLGERAGGAGGTKRPFTGGAVGVRAGYRASRVFALELYGDVGQLKETYQIAGAELESSTTVVHWQITPMLRFATLGGVRFTAATGFGAHGLIVDADIHTGTATAAKSFTRKGSGVAASWLVDLGMQFDLGPVFLEAVAFFDMHGVGTARDDDTNQRFFLSSPGTRAGLRVGLGISF
jgi:hypothetical protein